MIAWALRTVLVWGLVAGGVWYAFQNKGLLLGLGIGQQVQAEAPAKPAPVSNKLVYRAGSNGHVALDAAVNGTPVRFLVDTGASFVTLSAEDARAAGLRGELRFSQRVHTANGEVRVAPVKLRELRLGQLTMEDVDAVVVETPLRTSLLGMSFLRRLDSYEMKDGVLVMSW